MEANARIWRDSISASSGLRDIQAMGKSFEELFKRLAETMWPSWGGTAYTVADPSRSCGSRTQVKARSTARLAGARQQSQVNGAGPGHGEDVVHFP